jgi:hypothetical protein
MVKASLGPMVCCRKGHLIAGDNIAISKRHKAGVHCRICVLGRHARYRAKHAKFKVIEPESWVVEASEVPERLTVAPKGFYAALVRRAALLEPGQAVKVNLEDKVYTGGSLIAPVFMAAKRLGLSRQVKVLMHGGFMYVQRQGAVSVMDGAGGTRSTGAPRPPRGSSS